MPNIVITWEIGGKILETLPWEQPWVALKISEQEPKLLHMLSTKQMRYERNLSCNVTFGCTFTCHNYKGATLRANT